MQNLVIAEFPAKPGKIKDLEALLTEALVDTRGFEGCISLDTYLDTATSTIMLIEDWESFDHYDRYLNWRFETGLAGLLDPLLEGGHQGLRIRKCEYKGI